MRAKLFVEALLAVSICLSLPPMASSAVAQNSSGILSPAQTISPADMTSEERDYYRTLDGAAAKNFIVTRSYVRLCQQVVAHTLPAQALPLTPTGFSLAYLLPDESSVVNDARGEYLKAIMTKALEKSAPEKK